MRTAYINPDFRPNPKTECWCYVCSRDLDPAKDPCWIFVDLREGRDPLSAIHYEDADESASRMRVGPDCASRIDRKHGPGFVVRGTA